LSVVAVDICWLVVGWLLTVVVGRLLGGCRGWFVVVVVG